MDKAKKKRATHQRNGTKLVGKVNQLIANGAEGINAIMLKHYMNELKEKQSDLNPLVLGRFSPPPPPPHFSTLH